TCARLARDALAVSDGVARFRQGGSKAAERRAPRGNAAGQPRPAHSRGGQARAGALGPVAGPREDLPVVAVTGAAHDLGFALTARLAQSDRFSRVIAIDDHRGDLTGVIWRVVDIRDPALAGRLSGIDVVVHTDLDLAAGSDARARRAYNVRGAQ